MIHVWKYPLLFQGVYVTEISEGSAASNAGLMVHDKILQCNGYDFTMVSFDNMNGKADLRYWIFLQRPMLHITLQYTLF